MSSSQEQRDRIAASIREVFARSLGLQPPDVEMRESLRLNESVAMDSVAAIEFVVALEKHFGIQIGEDWLDIERLADIPRLAGYIEGKISAEIGGRPA
jgi:acyl carrier protein